MPLPQPQLAPTAPDLASPIALDSFRRARPNKRGFLGRADVRFPGVGLRILGLLIKSSPDTGVFALLPGRPRLVGDAAMRGDDGEIAWQPVIAFTSLDRFTAFSDSVISAIRAAHPGALP